MKKALVLGVAVLAVIFATCSLPLDPPAAAKAGEGLPPAPQGITVAAASETSVALMWNAVSGAVRYFIYRSAEEDAEYERVASADGGSYTDESLEPDSGYYYKVSTVKDNAGEGPRSPSIFASTKKLPPPENVTTRVVTAARIDIEWDAVDGAASYKIYRSQGGGQYETLGGATECSYKDEYGISANNTYYYKVSTVSEIGEGKQSEAYPAATSLPETPQNITAAVHSENSIAVSWQKVSGATRYRVYRGASVDGGYSPLSPDTPEPAFIDTGLSADTDYFYKVKAFNGIGEGSLSEEYAVAAIKKPQPPAEISVTSGTVAGSLSVSWEAVADAASYMVYRAGTEGGVYSPIGNVADDSTTYTDSSLVMGNTYFYKVSSVNAAGEGEKSAAASAVAPAIPIPGNFTATVETASSIKLSWSAVTGATGYKLYRALTLGGDYSIIATVQGSPYLNTGLSKGTAYHYKIASVSGTVESGLSAPISVTIAVPAAPTGLTVEPVSSTSLKVSWDPVPGAKLYSIYRDTSSYVDASDIKTSTTNTEYVNTGLDPFCLYYYKVSAVNDIGTGNLSAEAVSAYTQPIPLTNGTWYVRNEYLSGYHYYSFPVTGGDYYIQWANASQTNEADTYNSVSAYWSSKNSMTDLTTTYFENATNGFASLREIHAPNSGYIILKVYKEYSYSNNYSIRFYK
ncbi:MAG: fibronectin type III domain-containing protein [Spirochaetaceae bacterium]|jgi:fibronectin type 3 domain-containing protein|nr:fibronectin type III domain-containing protein [Spirochaetaceae bacterium]